MKYTLALFALVAIVWAEEDYYKAIVGGVSGTGKTTRYWDCCKVSCAWKENIKTADMVPVSTCSKDGVTKVNASLTSGCEDGGGAYMCNSQQPWAVNDSLAYGFAAASFTGGSDVNRCCACIELTFTDQLVGKKMVVQVTNTGSDLSQNHFDIALPGGGVGIFTQGCHDQWSAPWTGWGDQYGGVSSRANCSILPTQLQAGCHFRFDWYENANNPAVTFKQVTCPSAIVNASACNLANS